MTLAIHKEIKSCTICSPFLEHEPNPVVSFNKESRILLIGQAPGSKVHKTGVPWDDASGKRLREWLGVTGDEFYNPSIFALIPMGFCYPGKGKSGDLPPRPECAPKWHSQILRSLEDVKLTLLIGQYAQKYYLKKTVCGTLTETVKNFEEYLPEYLPIPHPSPRNNIWLKKNEWFEKDLLPIMRQTVNSVII
jgi:uracil-DNA glycosylase